LLTYLPITYLFVSSLHQSHYSAFLQTSKPGRPRGHIPYACPWYSAAQRCRSANRWVKPIWPI